MGIIPELYANVCWDEVLSGSFVVCVLMNNSQLYAYKILKEHSFEFAGIFTSVSSILGIYGQLWVTDYR